jgi:hypothetical protein
MYYIIDGNKLLLGNVYLKDYPDIYIEERKILDECVFSSART